MKDICSVFAGLDTQALHVKNQSTQTSITKASLSLNFYFGCYDIGATIAIKQQLMNIGVAELALFKASKLDIASIDPEVAKNAKISNPKNIKALLAQEASISTLGDKFYYTKKYVHIIRKLEIIRKNISVLPYCQSLEDAFDHARKSLCIIPLNNGIVMFWSNIMVCIGFFFFAWVFLNAELSIKNNTDSIKFKPSQLFYRFANYTAREGSHVKYRQAGEKRKVIHS